MPDALSYRQQAERFARVADQCTIRDLVSYYQKLAADYAARAERAAAGSADADGDALEWRDLGARGLSR